MENLSPAYIDKIKKFSFVGNFNNLGIALVYTKKKGFNFINTDGNTLLPLECSNVTIHEGGVFVLTDKRQGTIRYVDSSFNELSFIHDYVEIISRGNSGFCHHSGITYSMLNPPQDARQLYLADIENNAIISHYDRNLSIYHIYDLSGNEILQAKRPISVLKIKDDGIVVCSGNEIKDFSENITLKLQWSTSSGTYFENKKLKRYGNHIWYNNKLIPLMIKGATEWLYLDDGSILCYHIEKYNTECFGPKCGTLLWIKSYTNRQRHNIKVGEFKLESTMTIKNVLNMQNITALQPLILESDVTVFDFSTVRSQTIVSLEKEQRIERCKEDLKLYGMMVGGVILLILMGLLMFLL